MYPVDDYFALNNDRSATLAETIAMFIPKLIVAILIWVVAWLVARVIKIGLGFILKKAHVDTLANKLNINKFLKNANFHSGFSGIIADIVFWLIYLFGINIALEYLGLQVVSELIADLIEYIPNLFVAVLIILLGTFVAKFVKDLTDGAVATAKMKTDRLGHVVYVILMLFVIVTALKQAQVDISFLVDNINTIVMGVMLAIWLAFGLWGKDKAKEIIEKYTK